MSTSPVASPRTPSPTDGQAEGAVAEAARRALHARAQLDELDVALKGHTVTFHEVARAWFAVHDRDTHEYSDEERAEFERNFKRLYMEFAEDRGGIESSYFCEYIDVAAALTDIHTAAHRQAGARSKHGTASDRSDVRQGEPHPIVTALQGETAAVSSSIHIEVSLGHPEQWEAKELLFDCADLHYRALEFLRPKHRKVCLQRIFAIVVSALGTLDARAREAAATRSTRKAKDVTLTHAELQCLKQELADTETYFRAQAARRAQLWYFLGMICAALALGAIWLVSLLWASVNDPLLITMVSGGVGAVVSVMMRLTRHQVAIDGQEGKGMNFVLGMFRPLTGAVFGVLLFMFLKGGLLTFAKDPPNGTDGSLYYGSLAFVAGFSERAAQVVVDTGARMLGAGGRERTEAPK